VGSVVISVDAELGWGFHDQQPLPEERIEAARSGWRALSELFERHRLPATWAVVGHLLLEDCDGNHDGHPTPPGWFAHERNGWADRPDLRFGGDLIERLLEADPDHDIGCHTFSHVVFDSPAVTDEVVRAELGAAAMAASERGLAMPMRSFVFPRNQMCHREVLAECGYRAYRAHGEQWGAPRRDPVGKLRSLVGGNPRLVEPRVDEFGMVAVPASLYLFGFEGRFRAAAEAAWDDPVARQAERGIDAAADGEGLFHLWLHPNNLVEQRHVERVARVLGHVADRRDGGDLRVETMGDVADRCLG